MANGKLSSQLETNQTDRLSRTQRVQIQEAQRKNQLEQEKFNRAKAEAERLQTEVFITSNPSDPFTIEKYSTEYSKLTPDVQQFFTTPEEVKTKQQQQVDVEKANLTQKIEELKAQKERILADKQHAYEYERQNYTSKEFNEYIDTYDLKEKKLDIQISSAQGLSSEIDKGATATELLDFADEKAEEYESNYWAKKYKKKQQAQAEASFKSKMASGQLQNELNLLKLNLPEYKDLTYETYQEKVGVYNKSVAGIEATQKTANMYGYSNLPLSSKKLLNPTAYVFMEENPDEKVKFSYSGDIVGVKSGMMGEYFPIKDYNKQLNLLQQYSEEEKYKQTLSQQDASKLLKDKGFGKDVSFVEDSKWIIPKSSSSSPFLTAWALPEPKASWQLGKKGETGTSQIGLASWQEQYVLNDKKILNEIILNPLKIGLLSSPAGMIFSETSKDLTWSNLQERSERTGEVFNIGSDKPIQFNPITLMPEIPLYKYMTLSFATASKTITEQNKLDYKQEQAIKMLEQLDKIVAEVPEEQKSYVQEAGFNVLKEKGLEMSEEYTTTNEKDVFGEYKQLITTKITDKSFGEKWSENRALGEKGYQNKDWITVGGTLAGEFGARSVATYYLFKGFKAVGNLLTLPKILPTFYHTIKLQEKLALVPITLKATKMVAGTTLEYGLLGLWAFGKFTDYPKVATTPYGNMYFWAGLGGEVTGMELGGKIFSSKYNYAKSWVKGRINFDPTVKGIFKTRIFEADISNQGFLRYNKKLGNWENIYMERYKGFSLKNPKTWMPTIKGQKTGTFLRGLKKIQLDEVTAYLEYGGDVALLDKGSKLKVWRTKNPYELMKESKLVTNAFYNRGSVIYRSRNLRTGSFNQGNYFVEDTIQTKPKISKIIRAEPFPFAPKSTHLKWFLEKNIQYYGIGKYSDLPIKISDRALGYSATSNKLPKNFKGGTFTWVDKKTGLTLSKELKGNPMFLSGKGLSGTFLRIYNKGAIEEELGKMAVEPNIQTYYFDKKMIQTNKVIREVKGKLGKADLKYYLYKFDTGIAGTGNIPGYKKEVEMTSEMLGRKLIRNKYYIMRNGWTIPIEENIPVYENSAEIGKLAGELKLNKILPVKQSYIPSSSPPPSSNPFWIFYSINKKVSSNSSKPKSYSSIMSAISKISGISGISKSSSSRVSKISGSSSTSSSRVSSLISRISRMSYGSYSSFSSSTSYTPRPSRVSKPSMISSSLQSKVKSKLKKFKMPSFLGLLPDFTARSIGLSPKELSVKDALKEMKKIQTGFEVRKGGRLKGYTPIDEKSLMAGIMK